MFPICSIANEAGREDVARSVAMQYAFDFYDGSNHRPEYPERLFFGLMPDCETGKRMARFGDWFHSENHIRANQLQMERLHVSLHHIGDYKRLRSKFVYAARQAAKAVLMRPFEVEFRSVLSFPVAPHKKDRPLVLLGEEGGALRELFHALGCAMTRNGLKAAPDFVPHMTLSYGPQFVPLQAIEPLRFVASNFVLIHSFRGLTRYEVLGSWSLAA
jgi:RNA 2',3'-cyclic 3'-phosphodiesterase